MTTGDLRTRLEDIASELTGGVRGVEASLVRPSVSSKRTTGVYVRS